MLFFLMLASKWLSRACLVALLAAAVFIQSSMTGAMAQSPGDEGSAAQCRYNGGRWSGYRCEYPPRRDEDFFQMPDLFSLVILGVLGLTALGAAADSNSSQRR